ncbi:MAG: acetyltransferase [Proteobacteria bacterium]|nr:MAG: acetyltransferase [Pseudomonadota bacterium]
MFLKVLSFVREYGLFHSLSIVISLLRGRLLFPNSRLIRFPFHVRGRSRVEVGKGFTTGRNCKLEIYLGKNSLNKKIIVIGKNFQMNDSCRIVGSNSIVIGDNVLVAGKVFITDLSHGVYGHNDMHDSPFNDPKARELFTKPVVIEDNVWIGEGVSILPGSTIRTGSIVGSNSVVSGEIPAGCIATGIPARVLKRYNPDSRVWEKVKKT